MKSPHDAAFRRIPRQRGMVLILSLIVLVAMIMASVALVRSVDISTQIAGNLAYRQSGVQAGDIGVELARKQLLSYQPPTLWNSTGLVNYFDTWDGGVTAEPGKSKVFDPKTFDWTKNTTALPTDQETGNEIRYVIHRMCASSGDPAALNMNCHTALTQATTGPVEITPGDIASCRGNCKVSSLHPFYRITVKVRGPRETITYVQAVVY